MAAAAAGASNLDASEGGEDFFFLLDVVSAECTVAPPPRLFSVSSSATQTHTLSCCMYRLLAFARLNARRNSPRASKTLERLWRKKEGKKGIKRDTVRSLQLRGGAIIRRGGEKKAKGMKSCLGVFACNPVTPTKAIADKALILKLKPLENWGYAGSILCVFEMFLKKGLQSFLGGNNCLTFKV